MKSALKIVKNEFRDTKRILPEQKPRPLTPPQFDESEEHLIDFHNPNLKWHYALTKEERRMK